MTMQLKRGSFSGIGIRDLVSVPRKSGGEIQIRAVSLAKGDNARTNRAIRIGHLHMASRAVVERIAEDERMKPAWFCLRVMTGMEVFVDKALQEAGVESLVVMSNPYKKCVKKRVRIVPAHPVMAGYVLVRCLPLAAAMMGLLGVDNVLEVVGGAVDPYRARDEEIERFKGLALHGKYDHRESVDRNFLLGQEVRVTDGPFASFPGTITALDDEHNRAKVDVMIFGRLTPVELDIDQFEKV